MKFLLIVMMFGGQVQEPASVRSIEFETLEACQTGAQEVYLQQWERQVRDPKAPAVQLKCVPKGTKVVPV